MNKTKDFSTELKLLLIGIFVGAIPTLAGIWINNQGEDKRILTQAMIVRQNIEIEKSRVEIENFIRILSEYKAEANIILRNLMKSNVISPVNAKYTYAPDLSFKNFNLDDKTVGEKGANLVQKITPELQDIYFQLRVIENVPVDESIMSVVNGLNWIILQWIGHHNDPTSSKFNYEPYFSAWYPQEDLELPPKEPYKLQMAYMERLDQEIKELSEIRKRIIRGGFQ